MKMWFYKIFVQLKMSLLHSCLCISFILWKMNFIKADYFKIRFRKFYKNKFQFEKTLKCILKIFYSMFRKEFKFSKWF
jgi:hypothetical protein